MGIEDIMEQLDELGLSVDEGNLIESFFVPDGTVRIHREGVVVSEGKTLEEAFDNLPDPFYLDRM